MALAQLLYVSRLNRAMPFEELGDLVARSRESNRRRDITGILMCRGSHLMQLLEGELTTITALFERIRADGRHFEVHCLLVKNVARRLFPEWGMELADLEGKPELDLDRLRRMLDEVRLASDTAEYAVEARVMLADFRRQLGDVAVSVR